MFIIGVFFFVLTASEGLSQVCNNCSQYNTKCISSTQYQFCDFTTGALVTDTIFTCATGQLCSTASSPACADGSSPDCTCGTCQGNMACISDTQFQVCLDGLTPTAPTISCGAGTKCNAGLGSVAFCTATGISGCDADVVLTCPAAGRFPIPKTLCKSYYLCSYINTAWMMYYYNCTGTFNFDPNLQKCTSTYSCPVAG